MAKSKSWGRYLAASLFLSGSAVKAADLQEAPKVMPAEAKASDSIIGFSFYSQYASDYNFRGISNSNRQGSYQSFFEVQYFNNLAYTAFYTWQTRLPTRPDFEFDLTAGIRPVFGNLSLDLGFLYYFYPNEQRLVDPVTGAFLTTANSDFYEISGKALYQVAPELILGANLFYSPNWFGQHATGTYASGTVAYTLPSSWFSFLPEAYSGGFSASAEIGHYFLGAAKTSATGFVALDLPSYIYGNVGLSYTYKNLLLDLRFHKTDLDTRQCFTLTGDYRGYFNGGRSGWCGDAIIGSIRWQASTTTPGVYAESDWLSAFFK
ncbi:TorF family putative porin [Methylobacterium sp. R2-1]|uniref:TorF family putative porin n=1 Tax=Methylobacterium sp. R2-1 TaxID=2587064 RepID=UPI00185EF6FD|nr:TorF family putative porin [Methylobacterium sp. R2-1]MBB2963487.1 hypothetical protein [Methylobacterium sp. R2-1]